MKSAFDKIAAGFDDAIAYVEDDKTRRRETAPLDIKAVRKVTKPTQPGGCLESPSDLPI